MADSIMQPPPQCGRRLLPVLVDEIAHVSPGRPFVAIPRSPDPKDGFLDISYHSFAEAINKCAWWIEKELGRGHLFETITYMGPLDLLYPILIFAAVKTGHKVSSGHCQIDIVLIVGGIFQLAKEQLRRPFSPSRGYKLQDILDPRDTASSCETNPG